MLVGDTKQLPPFVETALEREGFLEAAELRLADLRETIFGDLLAAGPDRAFPLTHQHRMLRPSASS